ncbi:DNA polymerase I [Wolbachia endosymbiont of Dirofilaria (Dirofilaria) immitis]|uniref:DNA polymerase I n=1 Tax=Wolbachia endosymbiont of Dirofilaria (Dirofilaria) immitis TaxID=1812115 RepID=UPI00158DB15C|nr:DNA polymerase I [Wolbachia endosymbiont of Dirofilaria (Dirofilaria) immitis]QKX02629.1 DNA polymerase I [Wolbachia endosymbiont of Dirofilaria (Dirofilaria) immitis]
MQKNTFTIIDGYSFLFRAYHVLHHLTTTTGTPIGAVYGFLNMVLKYITYSDYLAIAFDSGRKNFRQDLYPEYKANRIMPPEDLISQFAILREAVEAFNFSYEEIEGYEADDIIATLAIRYASYQDFKVVVVSSDKDLFQLLNYNILIFDPIKNVYIDEKQVIEKFGVNSNKLLDLFSLIGDTSDNVPGVPGIGLKTAVKLLNEFDSLDNIIENINYIKQTRIRNIFTKHKEKALISRKLLSLCEKVDLQCDIAKHKVYSPNMGKLLSFLRKYEFDSLIGKVEKLFFYRKPEIEEKIEYKSKRLERFLENCRYEGKIAIYCHFENNVLNKISLSYSGNSIFYINQNCLQDAFITMNSTLFSNGVLKIIHNIRKVKKTFPAIEKALGSVDDLMTMSYSLDTGKHDHSISSIIAHNLSEDIEILSAKALIVVHEKLVQRLFQEKLFTIYERFDKPLMKVILNMEKNGMLLDTQKLQELSDKFQQSLTVLESSIYNLAGRRFNIASPKQLSDILFDKMGLSKKRKLKSGLYSTSSEVLKELKMEGVKIASEILNWRRLSKLKGTYTDTLIKRVDSFDSRVHTNFSTTATGRLSSSNPNLQNIPVRSEEGNLIRQAFIAPEGCKIVSADYSQIELRLLAHIADIASFKEAFTNRQDIHSITARQVFRVREGMDVDKQLRQKAKSVNFGIIYGISPFGLAKRFKVAVREAAEYIDYYFSCYPEIKIYMKKEISIARQHGYVETLFGRRCFLRNINNTVPYLRRFAERAAINAPVQGTAADVIKLAMVQLYDQLKSGKIILQVHDELLVEVKDNKVQETVKLMKDVMENVVKISVPLEVKVKISDNWGSGFLNYGLNTVNSKRVNHLN